LPLRNEQTDWVTFGGGVDHVIYPGETLVVARFHQPGFETNFPIPRFGFPGWNITVQLSAEDMETKSFEKTFEERRINL
jgi:hypothetical protein